MVVDSFACFGATFWGKKRAMRLPSQKKGVVLRHSQKKRRLLQKKGLYAKIAYKNWILWKYNIMMSGVLIQPIQKSAQQRAP